MPDDGITTYDWQPDYITNNEGLTIPAQVNYVGLGANLYQLGYEFHGSSVVINKFLSRSYLWEKIRVQGGAYGGLAMFDANSGVFNFLSYRDPNLLKTLENYRGAADFLRKLDLSHEEVVKSIVGGIGVMDSYQLPDAKGYASMVRHLTGYTDAIRQQTRDEILGTTLEDFKRLGEVLAGINESGAIVVMGSQQAIASANTERPDLLPITKVL